MPSKERPLITIAARSPTRWIICKAPLGINFPMAQALCAVAWMKDKIALKLAASEKPRGWETVVSRSMAAVAAVQPGRGAARAAVSKHVYVGAVCLLR